MNFNENYVEFCLDSNACVVYIGANAYIACGCANQ